jgi:hypothetical protein
VKRLSQTGAATILILLGVTLAGLNACTPRPRAQAPTAPRPNNPVNNNPSPTISPTAPAVPNRPGQPFPNQLVQDFVAGCTQAGVSASACRCTITRVQQTYSFEQFNEINQAMGRGAAPPASFTQIVDACKQA